MFDEGEGADLGEASRSMLLGHDQAKSVEDLV
jgi:hypothetical protein